MAKSKLIFNPISGTIEFTAVDSKINGRVDTFSNLPDASSVSGEIYVVEQDTGSIFLFNKREAGLYRSNGTSWEAYTDITSQSVEIDDTNIGSGSTNLQGALDYIARGSWEYFATNWDTAPTVNKVITGGTVYNYTLNAVTRFRFVPSIYDSTQDCFYTTFDSGTDTLSGPLICRGF